MSRGGMGGEGGGQAGTKLGRENSRFGVLGGKERIKSSFFQIFCVRKVNESRDEVPSSPLLLAAAPLPSCGLRLTCTVFTAALSTALHYTLNHLKDLKRPKSPLQLIHPDRSEHGANGRRERNEYIISHLSKKKKKNTFF